MRMPRLAARARHGLLLAACAATGTFAQRVDPVPPEQLFERLAPSVWTVQTLDAKGQSLSQGSAVVIGPGSLVTNCHVLAKSFRVSVARDNVSYGASLAHSDTERDLCLLKVRNFQAPAVAVGDAKELKIGARVYAIGSPRGLEQTISDGLLSGLLKAADGEVITLQITVPISPGSSGGGLFDARGRLIGITSFQLRDAQNLNFALPATWIAEVPRRGKDAPTARTESTARDPAPASNAASNTVFEYRLRERLTGIVKPVVYRLDRVEGDRLVFNQGTRVEKEGGEVVSIDTAIAGEFEQGMPPGGWYRGQPSSGKWDLRYTTNLGGTAAKLDLTAEVIGEATLQVLGRAMPTTLVRFTGYMTRVTTTGHYAASVWYSPELGRVVRFQVKTRSSTFFIEETLELIGMR